MSYLSYIEHLINVKYTSKVMKIVGLTALKCVQGLHFPRDTATLHMPSHQDYWCILLAARVIK